MTTAAAAHKAMLEVLADHRARAKDAREGMNRGHITPDGAKASLDGWAKQNQWHERLDAALEPARADAKKAKATIAASRQAINTQGIGDSTNEQLLFEQRASRTWNRARIALDGTSSDVAAFSRAFALLREARNPAERTALLQELPSYLETRGAESDKISRSIEDALVESVPEYQAAIASASVPIEKLTRLETNNMYIRQELEKIDINPMVDDLLVQAPSE